MAVYSVGTPVVGAQVKFKKDGELKVVAIAKGDELSNIVIDNYPADVTVPAATVVGFTIKSFQMPRSNTKIFDGIPTYLPDTNGESRFCTIEETSEIDQLLVEIPGETEDAPKVKRFIKLENVKSFEGGTAVETGSTEDGTSVKEPVEESEVVTADAKLDRGYGGNFNLEA